MPKNNFQFLIFLVALLTMQAGFSFASETNGTITSGANSGFAWSNNVGWVNFGDSEGNVHITDSGLSGYAWSDKSGWISLQPTNGGVDNADGTLSGYAWGAGLGWINFSGVTIDSSGVFHGSATGSIIGTLKFDCTNCSVTTDWRPSSARTTTPTPTPAPGNGGAPGAVIQPSQQAVLGDSTVTNTPEAPSNAEETIADSGQGDGIATQQDQSPESEDLASISGGQTNLFDISIQPVFGQINGFLQFSLILTLLFISFLLLFIIYKAHRRAKINKINKTNKSYEKRYHF